MCVCCSGVCVCVCVGGGVCNTMSFYESLGAGSREDDFYLHLLSQQPTAVTKHNFLLFFCPLLPY